MWGIGEGILSLLKLGLGCKSPDIMPLSGDITRKCNAAVQRAVGLNFIAIFELPGISKLELVPGVIKRAAAPSDALIQRIPVG